MCGLMQVNYHFPYEIIQRKHDGEYFTKSSWVISEQPPFDYFICMGCNKSWPSPYSWPYPDKTIDYKQDWNRYCTCPKNDEDRRERERTVKLENEDRRVFWNIFNTIYGVGTDDSKNHNISEISQRFYDLPMENRWELLNEISECDVIEMRKHLIDQQKRLSWETYCKTHEPSLIAYHIWVEKHTTP